MDSQDRNPAHLAGDWAAHAAHEASKPVIEGLVSEVVRGLCDKSAVGAFDDVAARHLWNEYCWQLQEGPFDIDFPSLGSLADGFDSVVELEIRGCLAGLPRYLLQLLTMHTGDSVEVEELEPGTVSEDAIVKVVKEKVDQKAAARNLDLIGPDRADLIGSYVSFNGPVAEALADAGLLSELLSEFCDDLIQGSDDLQSSLGDRMMREYWGLLLEAAEERYVLAGFLDEYESELRELILDREIVPCINYAVQELTAALNDS